MKIQETIYKDSLYEVTTEPKFTVVKINMPEIQYDDDQFVFVKNPVSSARTRYIDNFYFYTNDTIIGRSLENYGEYTENEINILKNFIRKDFTIYDIGANIGYHTVAFSKLGDLVYAFEPNCKNLELLRKNVKDLPNVTVFESACSNKEGTLYVEDFDVSVPGNYGEMRVTQQGQSCQSVRIDDMTGLYAPDLIKIDVEGHELQVLEGSYETIKEFEPIIFYEAHGTELDQIFDMLDKLEYKLYWFPCMNYNPNNYNNNRQNIFGNGGVLNILAMPKKYPLINYLLPVKQNQSYQDSVSEYMQKHTQK